MKTTYQKRSGQTPEGHLEPAERTELALRILALVFIVVGFLGLVGCSDSQAARVALSDYKFQRVEIIGSGLWKCPGYKYETLFKAIDRSGERVKGVVCTGHSNGGYSIQLDKR